MKATFRRIAGIADPEVYKISEWQLVSFRKTLAFGFIPLTIPLFVGFTAFGVWIMSVAMAFLCAAFIISIYLSTKRYLWLSVNFTITASFGINLLYLLVCHNDDGLYFTVFLIIIAGIFLSPRAAFVWSIVITLTLLLVAALGDEYTLIPDFSEYFGQHTSGRDPKQHFITIIVLCLVGGCISMLFQRYFVDLLQKVERYHLEKIQLRTQLLEAQKMESIGIIASETAHDLGNAITSINSCANLILKKYCSIDETLMSYANNIHSTCQRVRDFTETLLSIARPKRSGKTPLDLHETVRNTISLLRDIFPDHTVLRLELTAHKSMIEGNGSQIQTVLMNLANNAKDAMSEGGTLTFGTSCAGRKIETSIVDDTTDSIVLSVEDTGVGMDEDVKSKIFTRFFSTKGPDKGNGLGLSIVDRIVKEHNGTIRVSSTLGKGARFEMTFPLLTEVPHKDQ